MATIPTDLRDPSVRSHAVAESLGLESGIVRVVAHDPAWARLFAEEAQRLRRALTADLPIALEHVGSTAVPGLAAKPVLDLLGGYPAGAGVAEYVRAVVAADYVYRGEQGISGREYFRRGEPCSHHLHLVVANHGQEIKTVVAGNATGSRGTRVN